MTLTVRFYFNLLTRLHRKNSSSSKARTTTVSRCEFTPPHESKKGTHAQSMVDAMAKVRNMSLSSAVEVYAKGKNIMYNDILLII